MRLLILLFGLFAFSLVAQKTSSEIYHDVQKLHSLKRVLYIAAHPDDENTRALAWFSLGEKAETAYLSLTRGDGGQNLIGNELSEDLGVLRTQELLAARSWDGAKQFFTRAVDFGYSKSAEESMEKWGNDEILSDVVRVIRMFKPDVIITRFPADERAGHGHHTASCMLALEAFDKAADPTYLPEQVAELGTWKTTSVYWNSSVWWDKELETSAANNPEYLVADIGGYDPLLGMSYNEIGTIARSQHKCQGFGAVVERGTRVEYFQYLKGEKLEESFFEKDKKSWSNLGNPLLKSRFDLLLEQFDFVDPTNNIPVLLEIRSLIAMFDESYIQTEKIQLIDQIIGDCLGLYVQVTKDDYAFVSGEKVELTISCLNRSSKKINLKGISINDEIVEFENSLPTNIALEEKLTIELNEPISGPYWLKESFDALFKVADKHNLGKAEQAPTLMAKFTFEVENKTVFINCPVEYIWRDPSFGERRREVISTPPFTANFDSDLVILKPGTKKTIKIKLHSFISNSAQEIHLAAPKGWKVIPEHHTVSFTDKHEEKWIEFEVEATSESESGQLHAEDNLGNNLFSLTEISYDHIPTQTIFKPAQMPCLALEAKILPGKVAYIKGVDDAVPLAIRELGFEVEEFEVGQLADLNLSGFSSVVLGIRIYNVHPELKNHDAKLYQYVENGGNLIMQYNTASRSGSNSYGPFPFNISRDRVTEEDAEVKFLAPDHPILNKPNKITKEDFENWVQERGLYFAQDYEENYTALFGWHDKGEEDVNGGLIVAKYGKGQFVYTGISFFRELPKGVAGAYKLFANILSYQP